MIKNIKGKAGSFITLLLILIMLIANVNTAYAEDKIQDGDYIVKTKLWHSTEDRESMGGKSLNSCGRLIVSNGECKLYIKLNEMDLYGQKGYLIEMNRLKDVRLNKYNYPIEFNEKKLKVVSNYGIEDIYNSKNSKDIRCAGKKYPKVLEVDLAQRENMFWVSAYVPLMGTLGFGEQICKMNIDYSDVKPISSDEKAKWKKYLISDEIKEDKEKEITKENIKEYKAKGAKADKNSMVDGKYRVNVQMYKDNANILSMGNATLNKGALITKEGNKYSMEISTRPMKVGNITSCLDSLQIMQSNGKYKYASVVARNNMGNKPSVFKFMLPSKETYLPILMDPKVEIMGNKALKARLKIDWNSLIRVSDNEKIKENTTTVVKKNEKNKKEIKIDKDLGADELKPDSDYIATHNQFKKGNLELIMLVISIAMSAILSMGVIIYMIKKAGNK